MTTKTLTLCTAGCGRAWPGNTEDEQWFCVYCTPPPHPDDYKSEQAFYAGR